MPRHKLSPSERTVRITIRVPESMRDGLQRMGGGDTGAVSRAVRWLWKRTYSKTGPKGFRSPAVEMRRRKYEELLAELRRLRKERRVLAHGRGSGR